MARLVIVSNRVAVPTERGARAGGLAVALREAMRGETLWFGWSGRVTDDGAAPGPLEVIESGKRTFAVLDLTENDYRRFYIGFANSALWPLLHYRLGLVEFRREDLDGYLEVNAAFAQELAPLLRPDDHVWVHDYQLIPLGAALRRLGVENRIGFFLHVPFVPATLFAILPRGEDLLRAMCDYDLVGFQTAPDRDNFLDCVARILGVAHDGGGTFQHDGRTVSARAFPIGIEATAFAGQARRGANSASAHRLRESLSGRTLMIGVDRLDYSKGLPNRFEGYARFLTRFPEHRGKVTYLQVAPRSRSDVAEYRNLRRDLDRMAGSINGRFADPDWNPLRYITRDVPRPTLAGYYREARVGIVTPLRDGMNLVAKEFIAAQDPDDPGVLVLSRFAGAAQELTEALLVNPYDPDEIAEALHAALKMSRDERRRHWHALDEVVRAGTAKTWCRSFVDALEEE
ncbi:MAG: trehalose-6-phosphate synthase [Rhodospirillales bacterium]